MKTILVASDLSERSDHAVTRAGALARESGARLVLLSVVDEELPETLRAATAETMRAQLTDQATRLGAKGDVRIEIGDASQDIHRVAREIDADLIVLGLHRLRPLMDLFTGTTMERLVRASERPVLLAASRKPSGSDGGYERVLVGIDFSPASLAAIEAAERVASDAEIVGFYAYHAPFKGFRGDALGEGYQQEAEREVDEWLETVDLPDDFERPLIYEGGVQEVMHRCYGEVKPDLIAIGAHGRSTLSPTLLGSFTEEIMRRPPCDLLIVRR